MIKRFISMSDLIRLIELNEQPKTIFVRNDNDSDTKLNWFEGTKEYFTEKGNSILFKLRKETLFAKYALYYYDKVLDEAEKKYLHGIIAPFRNRVTQIVKARYSPDNYRIYIYYKEKGDPTSLRYFISLPSFKCSTKMYEKMEAGRPYTLEELGL